MIADNVIIALWVVLWIRLRYMCKSAQEVEKPCGNFLFLLHEVIVLIMILLI